LNANRGEWCLIPKYLVTYIDDENGRAIGDPVSMNRQSLGEIATHQEAVRIEGTAYTVHSLLEISGGILENPPVVLVEVHLLFQSG
jgi:hypothetical protein